MDYCEHKASSRFQPTYRFSSLDFLDREVNLFTFYEKVLQRLTSFVAEPLTTEAAMQQTPAGMLDDAIRNALVLCLTHADLRYSDFCIRIDAYPDLIEFSYPGNTPIDDDQIHLARGFEVKNKLLEKLFSLTHHNFHTSCITEDALAVIYAAAEKWKLPAPEFSYLSDRTIFTFWTAVKASDENADGPDSLIPPVARDLDPRPKAVVCALAKHEQLSFSELDRIVNISEHHLRKNLNELQKRGMVISTGKSRKTRYTLSSLYRNLDKNKI